MIWRWRAAPFDFIPPVPDPRNPWSSDQWVEQNASFVAPQIADAMRSGGFNAFAVNYHSVQSEYLQQDIDIATDLQALAAHNSRLFWFICRPTIKCRMPISAIKPGMSHPQPPSLMAHAYQVHARRLAQAAATSAVPFYDLTEDFRQREATGQRLYWNYDEHPRGESYLWVGQRLQSWVADETSVTH